MGDNLALWEAVGKTDPSQVKPITGKPYKGSSPKPYYLIKCATETFGPCGIGWGFKIVSERVEDGAQGDKVHIAHVLVWYEWEGKRGEVEHVGQTMFAGKNKNGPFTDEDAPKKSVTDALVKALSMIGFAGDIFMGRYDDSKYVAELRQEFSEQEQEGMASRYVKHSISKIAEFTSADALKEWWKSEATSRNSIFNGTADPDYKRVYDAFVRRGTELTQGSRAA